MHVLFTRAQETADVLARMGATVDLRRYAGMPHTINEEEIEACGSLLKDMVEAGSLRG